MSINEVVDILERHKRCIRNSEKGMCDNDCKNCEYVVNPDSLMDALSIAVIKVRR